MHPCMPPRRLSRTDASGLLDLGHRTIPSCRGDGDGDSANAAISTESLDWILGSDSARIEVA